MCLSLKTLKNMQSYVLVLSSDSVNNTSSTDSQQSHYDFFTLDVFSFIEIDLKELPLPKFDKTYTMQGQWACEESPELVGGNILSHKFVNNPHYSMVVQEKTHV